MSYFLIDKNLTTNKETSFGGDEARHISLSRRKKLNDTILIQSPNQKRYLCKITKITKSEVSIIPLEQVPIPAEPKMKIKIFQALTASESLDLIIQKCTELGANEINIFHGDLSPFALSKNDSEKKLERWHKIIIESAKQCNRGYWPPVNYFTDLRSAMPAKNLFFASLKANSGLAPLLSKTPAELSIAIGPEGGFSETELALLEKSGTPFSLGPRVLRAETAAIASLAIASATVSDLA